MQPRLITIPYSFNGKLFEAYDGIFDLVQQGDWVCFMDGDVAFLEMADFGHVLNEYIEKYPETGMFTCYATRCHYQNQMRKTVANDVDSIKYYALQTVEVRHELHLKVKNVERKIAGHLIMMKKETWQSVRRVLKAKTRGKKILGFDTQLSYALLENGYDIKLMRGVLVFHYLRFLTGKNRKIK